MYFIQQRAADGHWFIRGSEKFEHDAAYHARRYADLDRRETIVTRAKDNVRVRRFGTAYIQQGGDSWEQVIAALEKRGKQ